MANKNFVVKNGLECGGDIIATGTISDSNGPLSGVTWDLKSAAFTAQNKKYYVASMGSAYTMTLPASPSAGDWVYIKVDDNASTNNLTIGRNGSNIGGVAEDLVVDVNNAEMTLVYIDATTGWSY